MENAAPQSLHLCAWTHNDDKSFYIFNVEICPTTESKKFAPKHFYFGIESNNGLLAGYGHRILHTHGLAPFSSNHFRIDANARLSVTGSG